jgi:hypothetical protein
MTWRRTTSGYIGRPVYAADQEAAIRKAIEQFKVTNPQHQKPDRSAGVTACPCSCIFWFVLAACLSPVPAPPADPIARSQIEIVDGDTVRIGGEDRRWIGARDQGASRL